RATREEVASFGGYLWSPWVAAGVRPTDRILTLESRHLRWAPPPWHCLQVRHEDSLDRRFEIFHRYRPTVVVGHTEAIVVLAREVQRRGMGRRNRVRLVFPFGWNLTPDARRVIRNGMGADPLDCYGAIETNWVGLQCQARQGLHIPSHRLIVQVAEPGRDEPVKDPKRPGEFVLTDLGRLDMPVIRYRMADVGRITLEPCPCGRPGLRIVDLGGRMLELFVAKDGRAVGPGTFKLWVDHQGGVFTDFRVIQSNRERVVIEYVPGPTWSRESMDKIRRRVLEVMGEVEVVEHVRREISTDPTTKHKRFVRAFDVPDDALLRGGVLLP
ncbi:MAG TPA: hypothetical protein VI643_04200, partial [Planctomycetota bacterium]|nr:hypothetical protein [Planctomycetota bacterium]